MDGDNIMRGNLYFHSEIFPHQKFHLFLWSTLFILLILAGCQKKSVIPDKDIIAIVGNRKIDWQLLQRSFYLSPKWGKGITYRQAYYNQLNYLIDQKLFAQAATQQGMNRMPELEGYLRFIKEKEMIKALYRKEVASKVRISEADYQKAYKQMKIYVKFAYFSSPYQENIKQYYKMIQSNNLDQIPLLNSRTDKKGTSPYFTFGDMAPELEEVVFKLQLNEVSPPIRVGNKWMVVKLLDGYRDKFKSPYDYAESKSKIKKIIFDRSARQISDRYLFRVLKDLNAEIKRETFFTLVDVFNQIVKNKTSSNPFPIYLSDAELRRSQVKLSDIKNEVLVSFNGGQLTVKSFLETLLNMPSGMRPQVNMAPQLKKAIAIVLRNKMLVREAKRKGLDKDWKVRYETQIQVDEILSRYWLEKLRDRVTITEGELKEFQNHPAVQKLEKQFGKKYSTEEIKVMLEDYKFEKLKIQAADSLRHITEIQVDTALLEQKIPSGKEIIKTDPVYFVYRELFN